MGLLTRFFSGMLAAPGAAGGCAACGQAILGPKLEALGRAWHPGHFRCSACNRALGARFKVGRHGEPFCTSHPEEEVVCMGCGHVHAGTVPTPLGVQCPVCRAEAVHDLPAASALLVQAQTALRQAGLPWWPQTFPLRLVAAVEWRERPRQMGFILTLLTTHPSGRLERVVQEIQALSGLPRLNLGMVLAHELGHAWVFHHRLAGLPRAVEEGFCEYCSSLWLNTLQEPRALALARHLADNPDPVYGGGYRKVLKVNEGDGLAGVLGWLGQQVPEACTGNPRFRNLEP